MFIVQASLRYQGEQSQEQLSSLINGLLAVWRMNGQVYGREFHLLALPGEVRATFMTPEAESLESIHDNQHVKRHKEELQAAGIELVTTALGRDLDGAEPCACQQRGSLVLFTSYVALESPLRCGDCFHPVPLYRTPVLESGEYYEVICWASDYDSCDSLQMNCSTLERAATRQLSALDSSLSKQGLGICQQVQDTTGLPVYYYLYKYNARSLAAEKARKCPSCGGEWLLEQPWHGRFDFRCDHCRLLSNIAWDVR
jgi:predicted  nucleic acid-binding Zn ribbon protein